MKVIYKYHLGIGGVAWVGLPIGAKILKVDAQKDIPCIWAEVDPDEQETEHHQFSCGS